MNMHGNDIEPEWKLSLQDICLLIVKLSCYLTEDRKKPEEKDRLYVMENVCPKRDVQRIDHFYFNSKTFSAGLA